MNSAETIPGRRLLQLRFLRTLALSWVFVFSLGALDGVAAKNLVENSGFVLGMGDAPANWAKDLWSKEAGTEFDWEREEGALGVAIIRNPRPNDARWTQTIRVEGSTWYHLSGFVRAVGVGAQGLGANLSLLRGFDHAGSFHGEDSGWQSVSLYFRTKPEETLATVACRLGGYGQESTGEVRCTGIELIAVSEPPPRAAYVYGTRKPATSIGGGFAASAILAVLLLGLWRFGRLRHSAPPREALLFGAILLALLAAKLAIAPYWSYRVDLGTYGAWAARLANLGPGGFYAPGYFADYPPGYMYALWGIGSLLHALEIPWNSAASAILLKLPAILADTSIAWLLYSRLRPTGAKIAWLAALTFAFNPALLLNSAVWGQTDSILSLFLLLAFLAQSRREFEFSWVFLALAVLTKPQALLVAPLFVLWPIGWWRSSRPITAALTALTTVFVVADPFRAGRAWSWLVDLYAGTAGGYAETSVNAMNLAAVLFGMRGQDSVVYLGLTAQAWSFVIGLAVGLAFLVAYLRSRERITFTQLLAAATLVAFVCLTRMHERYLYQFFVFAGLVGVTGLSGVLYWILSALFLTNQLVVLLEQSTATAGPVWLWQTIGILTTASMAGWLALTWRTSLGKTAPAGADALNEDDKDWARSLSEPNPAPLVPQKEVSSNERPPWTAREIGAIALLLAVGGFIRFWNLGEPTEVVFDETYFVEQARNYLSGTDFMDPHPPFAKWMIATGIAIFGDEPFGWRVVNAISGTALIFLMYLLGRELFRRRFAAFAAALFISFDGLFLVDSRIAVIDIHYIAWAVAAYILTLRLVADREFHNLRRLVLIGVVIGISVGAKLYIPFFSFLLVLVVLGWKGRQEAQRRHLGVTRYLFKPIMVVGWIAFGTYLLTYAGDFYWGWWHLPVDIVRYIFVEVPNYQAAVEEATHPYSSNWYSWPLLLKPIWYFWKDPGPAPGQVVGIWGAGNPAVWWASVPALLWAAWYAIRRQSFVPGFIVTGWVIHLLPWVGIDRTLFLYHYLPCLVFAFLALAWMLDRLERGEGHPSERVLVGVVLLLAVLPVAYSVLGWPAAVALPILLVLYQVGVFSKTTDPVRLGQVSASGFLIAVVLVAWYFLPIWIGTPISKQSWDARMWISSSGIMSWI